MHIWKLLNNGKEKVSQLHKVISNKNINLSARRLLLLPVSRPSTEYGSKVWESNKGQAGSLESIYWMELSGSLGVLLRSVPIQLEEICS